MKQINSEQCILNFIKQFKQSKPKFSALDTETNGLHIIRCKPFLLSFGFYEYDNLVGYTYTFDIKKNPHLLDMMMYALRKTFNRSYRTVMHNAKFDMHMLTNLGYPDLFKNITDSQGYIRLAHDAIPARFGGVPLGLKSYATQYITPKAKSFEHKLSDEKKLLKKQRNKKLQQMLAPFPIPESLKVTGKETKWTMKIIENFFSDKTNFIEDLPLNLQPIIKEWLETTPDPDNYENLNRENVDIYAHYDIIYTLEAVHLTYPVMRARKQYDTMLMEERLIHALYRMERVGFTFDKQYAISARDKVKHAILTKRKQLYTIAGRELKINSHVQIKELFFTFWQILLHSSDKASLAHARKNSSDPELHQVVDLINELRTLEKWYSTYILKWLNAEHEGKVYTTINQFGAVSGRVSSDFQQFPGKSLKDKATGEILFEPRRMFTVSGNGYNTIAYIDYSQIELRFQALFTILVMGGDKNLCRAFMPFQCYREVGNGEFDVITFDHSNQENFKDIFKYEWKHMEDNKIWKPVDLHSMTTLSAFPEITEDHPDFAKVYRKQGKGTNFACNYGANVKALMEMLGVDRATATRLFNGYNNAYKGIQDYVRWIQNHIANFGYTNNLFGRRYYGAPDHNARNYLVQGSSADFLKKKIIEADDFLLKHKTRFQMNIHDEMSFEIYDGEEHLILELQHIMQEFPDTQVPIIADLETTQTSWHEKKDYEPKEVLAHAV